MVQMNYFNKALDAFSTNVVNPMYYVFFSTATIIASLVLFQGLGTSGAKDSFSLLCGFLVIFMGVYLLNLSRDPEPPHRHGNLESGLMSEWPITFLLSLRFSSLTRPVPGRQTPA